MIQIAVDRSSVASDPERLAPDRRALGLDELGRAADEVVVGRGQQSLALTKMR
jgi:hypothetical protein